MVEQKPLLSICIPTYNRVSYLERLLSSLLSQIDSLDGKFEIIISDNASTDNTEKYCAQVVSENSCVSYVRNVQNEGWERNYSNLYIKARGRFVWLIGDDDYLMPDALPNIMNMLDGNINADVVYIDSQAHSDGFIGSKENITYDTYNTNEKFIQRVGVFFTFISGVIINKEKHLVDITLIDKYMNTDLNLLAWVYTALVNGNYFIYVKNKYVVVQVGNTGGYKLFTVFASNLTRITNDFFPVGTKNNTSIRKSAMLLLLSYIGRDNKKFESENYISVTDRAFGDLREYKNIYSIVYRSPFLCKFVFFVHRVFSKLNSIFIRLLMSIKKVIC
ncbi:glycosyltransferase involved in cell wall biosynthesis [Buttiauxella sp. JUb87]|nr:glycosyltransferase involved in cell wall biosynthesis [Buttiauxella sp. JUb87]